MTLEKFHLTKKNKSWRLEKAGSNRAVVDESTKETALQKSIDYLRKKGGSMRIHKVDGKIQEERTYPRSKDPRKTKG